MTTKYRPSALTAVLELMLVLAVGLTVLGVVRGWFVQAGSLRSGSQIDVTDSKPQAAEKTSRTQRAAPVPLWSTSDGSPSPFAAASSSAEPSDAWAWDARTAGREERPD